MVFDAKGWFLVYFSSGLGGYHFVDGCLVGRFQGQSRIDQIKDWADWHCKSPGLRLACLLDSLFRFTFESEQEARVLHQKGWWLFGAYVLLDWWMPTAGFINQVAANEKNFFFGVLWLVCDGPPIHVWKRKKKRNSSREGNNNPVREEVEVPKIEWTAGMMGLVMEGLRSRKHDYEGYRGF